MSSPNPWVFGIDGGGTTSRFRIESLEGGFLHGVTSTGLNPRSVGWEGVTSVLSGFFDTIYSSGSFSAETCKGGFAGIAGIGRASDRETTLKLLRETSRVSCPLAADTDALPALVGALGSRRGILLIAGTGSIALGAASDGRLIRSGGWGHILGDEGSAYDVGRKGIGAALAYRDGRGPATALLGLALRHFGIEDAFELIPAVYEKFDKSRLADFAKRVVEARNEGDKIAIGIFDEASKNLCSLVESVGKQMGSTEEERRIVFAGGFLDKVEALGEATRSHIKKALPGFRFVPPEADAVTGACALARKLV